MSGSDDGESRNIPAFLLADDEDLDLLEIAEEELAGVMSWLEAEIGRPSSPAVGSYYQEAAYVTINGNEESCGPSFSASATTVMAGFDSRGVGAYFYGVPAIPSAGSGPWAFVSAVDEGIRAKSATDRGCDGEQKWEEGEDDDDDNDNGDDVHTWLARLLGAPVFEMDEMPF